MDWFNGADLSKYYPQVIFQNLARIQKCFKLPENRDAHSTSYSSLTTHDGDHVLFGFSGFLAVKIPGNSSGT
ncbi:hypothetical protein M413DRAFT_442421 [Hebeloma cylindrosporum]|uniref:Uncharacterized protein n=1 Tax=Hebeloma cylindrosporum TaxID=76867 RepID=A0A0C3CKX1_HEBCY|nr:hypothetical protein M413DRAFT_442421 [Hebeloma cylindrosporum h7]